MSEHEIVKKLRRDCPTGYVKHLKSNYRDIYVKIKALLDQNISFPIKACVFAHQLTDIPKCDLCDSKTSFNKKAFLFNQYCSWCNQHKSPERSRKIKETSLKRYGTEHPFSKKSPVRQKIIQKLTEQYGVQNVFQLDGIKIKSQQTLLERFGSASAFQIGSKEFKQTMLTKYGKEYCSQVPEIVAKGNSTKLQRFGIKRAGMYTESVRDQMSASATKRIQNGDLYNFKQFHFSNRIEYVQGYEPQAIRLLLSHGVPEDDIDTTKKCPVILYDNKRYIPDLHIKSANLLIEVKSKYTFSRGKEGTLKKQKAAILAGFKHEIWIMSESGELLEKIIQ